MGRLVPLLQRAKSFLQRPFTFPSHLRLTHQTRLEVGAMQAFRSKLATSSLAATLLLSGCTSTLVHDDVKRTAGLEGRCSGSEWVDDSSIAVLPVPVVAVITPHFDLHKVSSEPYLNRCGASTHVVNRDVSVNRLACIPAGLTRIMTLGVWQWCPARVTWSADVLVDMPRPASDLRGDLRDRKS